MTREIKFRAWTNRDKCWVGAFAVHLSGLWRESPNNEWIDLSKQDEITLMQYTGLKDKNNKEIYEGDIVRRNVYTVASGKTEMSKPYEIIWDDEKAGFEYKTDGYQSGLFYEVHEIIGNIYENPDLLSTQSVDKK